MHLMLMANQIVLNMNLLISTPERNRQQVAVT